LFVFHSEFLSVYALGVLIDTYTIIEIIMHDFFWWERLSSRDQLNNRIGLIAAGKPLPLAIPGSDGSNVAAPG